MKKISNTEIIELVEKEIVNENHEIEKIFLKEAINLLNKERIAHLIVTMFVILFMLLFFSLFMITSKSAVFLLFVITLTLSCFYIRHYYKLENSISIFNRKYLEIIFKK